MVATLNPSDAKVGSQVGRSVPRLESRDFMIPGIVALLLLAVTTNLSAMAIVREKERGTMEQVRMSPIGPVAYVLGKTAPYFLLSLLSSMLIVAVSMALPLGTEPEDEATLDPSSEADQIARTVWPSV